MGAARIPARASSRSLALVVGAVVGGGRPVQGDGYIRGHIEPVVGYRQVPLRAKDLGSGRSSSDLGSA